MSHLGAVWQQIHSSLIYPFQTGNINHQNHLSAEFVKRTFRPWCIYVNWRIRTIKTMSHLYRLVDQAWCVPSLCVREGISSR
jgi:hypothetical protein